MDIRGLGYIGIGVRDVDLWRPYGELIGAMVSDDQDGIGLRLRIDDRPFRVAVGEGPDSLDFAGWEVPDAAALEVAISELSAAGFHVDRASTERCQRRRVRGMVEVTDPGGFKHELFHGAIHDHAPFSSPAGVSGFVTESLGMGHIVLGTPEHERCVAFYTDVLGFRVSDYWRPGQHDVVFFRCNPRHHSVAVVPAEEPALFHFMFEAGTLDDVGAAFDRHLDAGNPVAMGIGKHTNDRMVSFYSRSPAGFDVEFGCGGLLVDEKTWTVTEITKPSFWGHRAPA